MGTSEKKKQGGQEGQVSGTKSKQSGTESFSDEKARETRLERLRHSDYRVYWQKGGRGINPNRAAPEASGGEQELRGKGTVTQSSEGPRRGQT